MSEEGDVPLLSRCLSDVPISRRRQMLQHDELMSCIDRYSIQNALTISTAKDEILGALSKSKAQLDRIESSTQDSDCHGALTSGLKQITTAIFKDASEVAVRTLNGPGEQLQELYNEFSEQKAQQKCRDIADSLSFTGMNFRKVAISDVAQDTLDWMYDEESSPFASWLESEEPLFCIFGKPGSGKSCLMKSLSDDERTREALAWWRPSSTLIIVDHYFWYAGDAMQNSHVGLLRSLLHRIISLEPAMAACICPQRWSASASDLKRSWTRKELLASLRNIEHLESGKVFIMIDGLDEYYPHDQHDYLVDDLMALMGIPNLKICVSSRPWPVFEHSFAGRPSLRLEQFNEQDIHRFASDQLSRANSLASLIDQQSLDSLANEVASSADGIFLWVYLAVSALKERLRAGGNFQQLRSCLMDFPKDLEHYFMEMIYKRISATWREGTETACVLKLATLLVEYEKRKDVNPVEHRSIIYYWLLRSSDGRNDEDFALVQQIEDISLKGTAKIVTETARFLNSCTRDMFHIICATENIQDMRVDFTHRTIYDFITTDKMRMAINQKITENVRRPLFLLDLSLARFKIIQQIHSAHFTALVRFANYMWIGKSFELDDRRISEVSRLVECYCDKIRQTPELREPLDRLEDYIPAFHSRVGGSLDEEQNAWPVQALHETDSESDTNDSGNEDTGLNEEAEKQDVAEVLGRAHTEEDSASVTEGFITGLENSSNEYIPIDHDPYQMLRLIGFLTEHGQVTAASKMIRLFVPPMSILMSDALHCVLGVSTKILDFDIDTACLSPHLVESVLEARAKPNAYAFGGNGSVRTAWHLFLRKWIREAWPSDYVPDSTVSLNDVRPSLHGVDENAWAVAQTLLRYGASLSQPCCIAAAWQCTRAMEEHECCFYSVSQILRACVPPESRSELQKWVG